MNVGVYVIKDVQLDRYNLPFYARDDHEAALIVLRANIPKSIYNDTKLFRLGSFSDCASDGVPLVSTHEIEVKLLPYPSEGVSM